MTFIDFLKKKTPSYWFKVSIYPIVSTVLMFFFYRFDPVKTAIYFVTVCIACLVGSYLYFRDAKKRGVL